MKISRPLPWMTDTTPGGKQSRYALSSGTCTMPPMRGVLMTTELPMITAGTNSVQNSLSG